MKLNIVTGSKGYLYFDKLRLKAELLKIKPIICGHIASIGF